MSLTLRSPAKINLFLRVTHKLLNGYHELASLMQTVSLYDTLHIKLAQHDRFTCNVPYLPIDESNLVIRALDQFRFFYKEDFRVHVRLDKEIPIQAGLGGGSSDAATMLWGLNELVGSPFDDDELASIGAEIGSDVPFFFSRGTAYCRGRGEIVDPLNPLPFEEIWIVKPLEGLSTPVVYETFDLQADELAASGLKSPSLRPPEESMTRIIQGEKDFYNDLEAPAFHLVPRLKEIKEKLLDSGFSQVVLCGSGTALFCVGDGVIPEIVGAVSTKVKFINRQPDEWY